MREVDGVATAVETGQVFDGNGDLANGQRDAAAGLPTPGLVLSAKDRVQRLAMLSTYAIGGLVAFVSGLVAVYAVLAWVRRGKFEYFAYYCFAIGIAGFCYFQYFRGA